MTGTNRRPDCEVPKPLSLWPPGLRKCPAANQTLQAALTNQQPCTLSAKSKQFSTANQSARRRGEKGACAKRSREGWAAARRRAALNDNVNDGLHCGVGCGESSKAGRVPCRVVRGRGSDVSWVGGECIVRCWEGKARGFQRTKARAEELGRRHKGKRGGLWTRVQRRRREIVPRGEGSADAV